jgi:Fe-S-cluster containining protein
MGKAKRTRTKTKTDDRPLPALPRELPILPPDDPCRGCGACCRHLGWPPFLLYGELYGPEMSEEAWEHLEQEHPQLAQEIQLARERCRFKREGEMGPCSWYDPETRRCKHHELRPQICRDFEPGSEDCLRFRAEHGID